MSKSDSSGSSGDGCFLLFIVFLVLKLTGVIDWSWWWVTCPLWIGFAIFAVIIVVPLTIAGVMTLFGLAAAAVIAFIDDRKTRRIIRKGRGTY